MQKLTGLLFLCIFSLGLFAQENKNAISGKVFEETTKLPLEFVFVSVKHPGDSVLLGGTVTNKEGYFLLDSLSDGNYLLTISFLGFDTIVSPVFSFPSTTGENATAKFYMKASGLLLDGVEIADEKATFVSTIDRKIYFPEKDIQAQTGSASELLQNVPSVTVDADGNVSLRGSANVTILINGKPSQLMNTNAAAALEQIPASAIERIEIITNPSAKYKPDGVAGIINIVLKKNVKLGFSGAVTANASTLDRYNGNASINYNTGKYNIYGSYGYRQNYMQRVRTDVRTFRDSAEASPSQFDQTNFSHGRSFSHTLSFGMDYNFNKSNSFGFEGSYFNSTSHRNQFTGTKVSDTSGITSDYLTNRNDIENEYEAEGNFSFEHLFKKEDHEISFEAGWGNYGELEDSHFSDRYNFPASYTYDGHNAIRKHGNSYTAEVDYVNPVAEDMELEIGYEGEYLRDHLDFFSEHFDAVQSGWQNDAGRNNTFLFSQDVHALYSTFSFDIEDLSIMGGLRAEQTFITSNLITLDSVIPNNYFKLFPTAHFLYELSDNQEIGLSYSRRINRPDPDELNPFPEVKDPRNLESGNPNLKPEQVHSVELGYQFKNPTITFIPSLYYHYTYDAFTEITSYINDSVLLTTQDNLATDQSAGMELVFAWKYKKQLNVNFSSNIFYNTIDASNLGYSENKSAIAWDAKVATNFNIGKTTKLQLNSNYRSAMLTAQGHTLPVFFVNAGLRQDLFKRRASLIITASDLFNTMRWVEIIDTPLLTEEVARKRKSQYIFIGFTWRFGMIAKKASNEIQFDTKE
jgi:outer membrane receptor protein involved in Fe transport